MFSNDRNLLTVMNRIKLEGRNIVQVLAETEYQDLYRITDGVLLVINKFKPIDYGEDKYVSLYDPKVKSYNKGCQKQLKILKEDYYSKYEDVTVYQGTVLYYGRPVELARKDEWNYQIKTTGESLSGDFDEVTELLTSIIKIIDKEQEND
ncbi:hypothetical protein HMPREF1215_00801 [Coprococcus sp. HPP0074]|nr:hypothetical protein HMPREF1215_00801 [Coprococcus sp. HPP0074]